MNLVSDCIVPPFRHVPAHVLGWGHAHDPVSIRLPERRVPGRAALLAFYNFMEAFLVEVGRSQSCSIRLDRSTRVGIDHRPSVPSRTAFRITVFPEIRELGLLSANAENGATRTDPAPA